MNISKNHYYISDSIIQLRIRIELGPSISILATIRRGARIRFLRFNAAPYSFVALRRSFESRSRHVVGGARCIFPFASGLMSLGLGSSPIENAIGPFRFAARI